MFRIRRTIAVLSAAVVLAAACGNSPSGDGAAPTPDTAAPTTAAPATTAADASEPDAAVEAPGPDTSEPDEPTEPGADEPATTEEAPEPEAADEPDTTAEAPDPEADAPAPTTTTEPVIEEPVDPYPHRHDFVPLEGVPGVTDDEPPMLAPAGWRCSATACRRPRRSTPRRRRTPSGSMAPTWAGWRWPTSTTTWPSGCPTA